MLKTLKWVHDLTVRHERTRIARELESAMARHHNEFEAVENMLRHNDTMSDDRKQRLKRKAAVHREVVEIVNSIMQTHAEEATISSILDPEPKKVSNKQRSI